MMDDTGNQDQDGTDEMDSRDEARLSDWIEGEADPADAAAVEAMLREDPALAARVEAMAADRRRLRALPAVTVPAEVRAAIDDRVARTLLLQSAAAPRPPMTDPGSQTADWRRRRHRQALGRRWTVLGSGLAAAVVLVLGVSSLRAIFGPPASEPLRGDLQAMAPAAGDDAAGDGPAAAAGPASSELAAVFEPSSDAMVVHGLPLPTAAPADAVARVPAMPPAVGPADPRPAIRVRGLGVDVLEATLVAIADADADAGAAPAGHPPARIAVTRNLTTDTLARIVPPSSGRDGEPLWTELRRERRPGDEAWRTRVERRVQDAWNREAAATRTDGRVLAGAERDQPGWAEQIVFSESGAAWTLSVPASRVAEVLAAIDRAGGDDAASRLVRLDPVRARVLEDAAAWQVAREQLRRLAADAPDRIIHLPVILQSP